MSVMGISYIENPAMECNAGTWVPRNRGNPTVFKPVNSGLCAGKNPDLTGLILGVSTAQKSDIQTENS